MADRKPSQSRTTPTESIPGLPDYGWRVNLDFECTEKCQPFLRPRLRQILSMVGLGLRYYKHIIKCRIKGRRPIMDYTNPMPYTPMYGCPIGGIGCGTIGRGYRGEFCRFQMVPGMYNGTTVPADAFIINIRKHGQTVYQKVLTGRRVGRRLKAWEWGFPGDKATYHALYPRAWTVYHIPEYNLRLVCRQISPIIPHDYKDSSFPMAAFVWTVENDGSEELDVSIAFTFKNGTGDKRDSAGGCWNQPFMQPGEVTGVTGVMLHQTMQNMQLTYAIAGAKKDGVDVSYRSRFDPCGSGSDLWNDLKEDGRLDVTEEPTTRTNKGQEIGAAVCLQCTVQPRGSKTLEFSLAWDMPLVQFHSRQVLYSRRYARWFGTHCDASPALSAYCLENYARWEEKIEAWQHPVLQCSEIPAWYKSALFNELYYVSDGGTVWLDPVEDKNGVTKHHDHGTVHPHVKEYGKFAYLEGHEYRMYNTYDVHFYASFALIMLWPNIQLSLQYDMGDAILTEDAEVIGFCASGENAPRKTVNTVPHDVGDPEDEPWKKVNSYNIHPTDHWRDLNLKFVLQAYRDYHMTGDRSYLEDMYPIMKTLIDGSQRWDTDCDGLVENGGFADQTYDNWRMYGVSAYCGGMWLAALKMIVEAAKVLGKTKDQATYTEILEKGKKSFEIKLWNGKYYNYDCSTNGCHDSVMADQLAGNWYLKASGITDYTVFPEANVKSSLEAVFKNNVMGFANGNMGAINGTRPDGQKDISSCQAEEFWVGVTYAVAAQMIQENMLAEGFQTAWGNYNVCWEWLGFMFQTPEAYMTSCHFRSLGYMRPLAVWSMQWALEKYHPQLFKQTAEPPS